MKEDLTAPHDQFGENNIQLIVHGESVEKSPDKSYLEEELLVNSTFGVGVDTSNSDTQNPIYQVNVLTPKKFQKWKNRKICDLVKTKFKKGLVVLNDGTQSVTVVNSSATGLTFNETHGVCFISIALFVTATG